MKINVKAGDRFMWNPSLLSPPPIYVRVRQVRRQNATLFCDCWQRDKHWQRHFPIPLPPTLTPSDWTCDELELTREKEK